MANSKPESQSRKVILFLPLEEFWVALHLTVVGAMTGRRENTEQTEVTEQTENPKEIPSVPFFQFVPYSLIPFMIALPWLSADLPNSVAFVIYALS
jgi:hypothetical protein